MVWQRENATEQVPDHLGATPPASAIQDSQREEFRSQITTPGSEKQGLKNLRNSDTKRTEQIEVRSKTADPKADQPKTQGPEGKAKLSIKNSVNGPEGIHEALVQHFGVTKDPNEAGYILPDGRMLDLSGRHEAVGYENGRPSKDDYLKGTRNIDHRELSHGLEMQELIISGAVRMDYLSGVIDIGKQPTPQQMLSLSDIFGENDFVRIDATDARGRDFSVDLEQPTKAKVRRALNDSSAFLRGERESGNSVRFSLKSKPQDYDSVKADLDAHPERHGEGGKKDGALLAPNGKRSNLNERQWIQVRTQEFKERSGDWERADLRAFLEGEPVARLTGEEFKKEATPLTERVGAWFREIGGKVEHPQIGTILFNKRSVKDSIRYGLGQNKAAVFAGIPQVLKNGRIVAFDKNWKARGYDGFTLVAPIEINGKKASVVAIVHKDRISNRLYLHEVALNEQLHEAAYKTGASADFSVEPSGAARGGILSVAQDAFYVNPDSISVAVDENGEPTAEAVDSGPAKLCIKTGNNDIRHSITPEGMDAEQKRTGLGLKQKSYFNR